MSSLNNLLQNIRINLVNNTFSAVAIIIAFFAIFFYSNLNGNFLTWDIFGYYLYLPSFFIYNDIGLSDPMWLDSIVQLYHNTDSFYQFAPSPLGRNVNQYSIGMAYLYLPFFLIGHLVSLFTSYPSDGFSVPYQISIVIGSLFYLFLGLIFLRKTLLNFFSDKVSGIVIILIILGTNYFQVVSSNLATPHSYLFTLYCLLLWVTIKWHKNINIINSFYLGVIIGLLIIIRPTEIVSVFIPLFYKVTNLQVFKEKLNLLISKWKYIIVIVIPIFLLGFPQLVYWKMLSGDFLYYSYINKGEGLDFFTPHVFDVLLSFRKGWLLYTPVMLFAILGFFFLFKRKRKLFYAVFLFFIANFYLVSSWSCWWYATSFGQRSLVQSYAVLAFPLGAFLTYSFKFNNILRSISWISLTLLFSLNAFQTWQMSHNIIDGSRMTKAYYFSIFGQTDLPSDTQKELLMIKRSTGGEEKFNQLENYYLSDTETIDFEVENLKIDYAHSGNGVFQMGEGKQFSKSISKKYNELSNSDHAWIKVSLWVYADDKIDWNRNSLSLVATFQYEKENYKYCAKNLMENKQLKLNEWNKIEIDYLTPEVRTIHDEFKAYAWYRGKDEIVIDDLKVEVFNRIK